MSRTAESTKPATKAAGTLDDQLSFLPENYLERKRQRRANVVCLGLFITVSGVIGTGFWWTDRSLSEVEQEHHVAQQQFTEEARRIEQVAALRKQQETMARQAELSASLVEKMPRSNVLAELTNTLPDGVALVDVGLVASRIKEVAPAPRTKLDRSKKKADVEPVAQPLRYDVTLQLSGIAGDNRQVSAYLSRLKASPMFRGHGDLATARDPKDDKLVRFEFELQLDPDFRVERRATEISPQPGQDEFAHGAEHERSAS